MKSITVGLAVLLLGTAASYAAEAWKEADVGGTKIYTDANGMTLYTYDKDETGKSNCYDKCATNWPPLKTEAEGEWTAPRAPRCGPMKASRSTRSSRIRRLAM